MNSDQGPHILLLEDQALVRAGMRELILMAEPKAKILEASNFSQATDFLSKESIQYAFLDVDLKADKTGIDVLAFISSNEINVRAIMLSGNSEKEVVLDSINSGACGFIPKSMDGNDVFRQAIDTVLSDRIFLPLDFLQSPSKVAKENYSEPISNDDSPLVSGRSLQVLYYICQGLPNKSIARKLKVEEGTIRKHYVPKLFAAFKVARRSELIIEVSKRRIKIPRFDD
ncbi:response regulator [Sapientia aquatica]|uniref:Response regulator transcription factor n=1 Tax=Sapientia aquatica TaxID=1549640 RepID=A0A4V3AUG9_9BURK|nr:response regulator transcription factor [Sapientia aquatica]TDK64404.1 response regulator transcription factor [Sapientia aquatica]